MWIGIFISLPYSAQFSFLGLKSAFPKLHGTSENFFKNTNDGTMVVDRHNIVFGVPHPEPDFKLHRDGSGHPVSWG